MKVHVFRLTVYVAILGSLRSGQATDQRSPVLFPFVLPWDDSTPGVVDLSGWLHKPAGRFGHLHAGEDGHLYAGKDRIRLFGVDLGLAANFPRKEDSEKIAPRMAKFGINIVRFHIMDLFRYPKGILDPRVADTRHFDPEALDRLDYFAAQLKRHGIYTKLCLLNYRPFNAADGLPKEIERLGGTAYQDRHLVGFFDTKMLELQKEYARQLLTHRNPYLQATYTEDPAVALVEINNENGLIHAWLWGKVDELPGVFLSDLKSQWNRWLRNRYDTTGRLRAAWGGKDEPPGKELLASADFSHGIDGWRLTRVGDAEATATVADDVPESLQGGKSIHVKVARPGTANWHVRFEQAGIPVEAGAPHVLTFWAKADRRCQLMVHSGSLSKIQSLSPQWTPVRIVGRLEAKDGKARLAFIPPVESGSYWLASPSLRQLPLRGLAHEERLEDGSVGLLPKAESVDRTDKAIGDWLRFLWDTEDRYWQTMYRYLKDDLKVKAMVIGTMARNSTPNLMARLDCIDMHAYWGPKGSSCPSMVNERGGTIPDMALRRVLGKPFTVSEYGHPYAATAPKTCVSEVHLLRAAYAAFQDWDYLSATRYASSADWDTQRITDNLNLSQHPTKMLTLIPAAAMFLRGDVMPAKEQVVASFDLDREIEALRHARAWNMVHAADAGVPPEAALMHRVALATAGTAVPAGALRHDQVRIEGQRFTSDTGELVWDLNSQSRGVVTVNATRSKAVIGFGRGGRFDLGGVVVEPGPTRQNGWSAITLTVMEGAAIAPPCRLLITATGDAENTKSTLTKAEKGYVVKDWGQAPSLVEGIPARITLPLPHETVQAWTLDERGQRKTALSVHALVPGRAVIIIGPEHQTLWYEVSAK
jgi:hypothetical protein